MARGADTIPTRAITATPDGDDAVGERILEAALSQFRAHGIRRSGLEQVARTAGVARITVYRRFGNKDGLVAAVVLREIGRLGIEVDRIWASTAPLEDRLVDALMTTMSAIRGHPLFGRLLADEPETLLPALTVRAGPILESARRYIADKLGDAVARGEAQPLDVDVTAELLTRLGLSLLLTPGGAIDLDDRAQVRAFVRRHVLAGPEAEASP